MSRDLHKIELFELYLKGKLKEKDLSVFEERLRTEPELQEELNVFKNILSSADLHNKKALKKEINTLHKSLKEEGFFEKFSSPKSKRINMKNTTPTNSKFDLRKILGIAATIALLLVAGYFIFNPANTDPPYKEVFTKIYKPENVQINNILDDLSSKGMAASDDPEADSLSIGLNLYKNYKYPEARKYLFNFVEQYPENPTGILYLGLSLLQEAKYAKASQYLQEVTKLKDFKNKDVAEWYLAQCYLMFETLEERDYAVKILNRLAKDATSSYQEEAIVAIEMLK